MAICTQCGRANPDDARFCMACGATLAAFASPRREERKVVSVLFCDLVGFTASAHSADPEDVRRVLSEYHATVRAEIERFGGVVEKFIGDAAVGIWGVPQAHEDDAERAVRAALAILDAILVDVRIAVNTGEVLAALDPTVDPGEGIVGDVMNTAARLESAAPVGGILVGETTFRITRRAIEYEELEPTAVTGKPDAIRVWRVVGARSAPTSAEASDHAPFIGRGRELQLLEGVFERAVEEPGSQLVSVIGEPGIGKSRLVSEFEHRIETRSGSLTRLRGRCLAYGDGIGFWPLGEVVKQHLGLGETESAEEARRRLDAAVEGMIDAGWLRTRLAPLVGLQGEGGERDEVFTAWRRFFEEVASREPLVLVFEDLHWAHPAMLAFVQYLAEWSTDVPLLVVCTARPELFEAHPQWGGGLANATTLALRPLDERDTAQLAGALLGRALTSTGADSLLVKRCGGNPLYAEEYARLLSERSADALADPEMPETVQALIAARIDTLPSSRKALLHDAAVIGKAFWAGAVAALGNLPVADVRSDLHELARKELIRSARQSTIPGDDEYMFWHDLVNQVAYQQIPRRDRADKHRRAAEWIERTSGERLGDRAELIAHHYHEALRLVRASSNGDPESLRRSAVHYLTLAGERALGIDVEHAEELIQEGLSLSEDGDADRGLLLCLRGESLFSLGRHTEAREFLHNAARAAESARDIQTMGTALVVAFESAWMMGDTKAARHMLDTAVERLRREPPTDRLSLALSWSGCLHFLDDEFEQALPEIEEAIQVGERVGDRLGVALAYLWRGGYRAMTGESDGHDDYARGSAMLADLGSSLAPQGPHNAASATFFWHGPAAGKSLYLEAINYARRIHVSTWENQALAELPWALFDLGEWDELLKVADEVVARADGSASYATVLVLPQKARVLALRGETYTARRAVSHVLEQARQIGESQATAPALASAALLEYLDGQPDAACRLIDELLQLHSCAYTPLAEVGRILVTLGRSDQALQMITDIRPIPRSLHEAVSVRALLAESASDVAAAVSLYDEAVSRWRQFGNPLELAHALAGLSRTVDQLDAHDDARQHAAEAAALFGRLGVTTLAVATGAGPFNSTRPRST